MFGSRFRMRVQCAISCGLTQMTDVGGEYLLGVQGTHLDKISLHSLTTIMGSLLFPELTSLLWKDIIGARFVKGKQNHIWNWFFWRLIIMYFLCFLYRRRMWLQCLVLQTTAIGVEIWLQFSRLERIWIKIFFNLTRHLVRLNLTAHAVLQTTFYNHHKFMTYYPLAILLVSSCVCVFGRMYLTWGVLMFRWGRD